MPGSKVVTTVGWGFISRTHGDPSASHNLPLGAWSGALSDMDVWWDPFRRELRFLWRVARWNTIPGWNGIREFALEEERKGVMEITSLLAILPNLRGVVLVGRIAAGLWD